MTTLAQALAAARAEADPERRLEHLVEAWRQSRDPALADVIDAWVDALTPTRTPVGTATDSFQKAWLTRAEAGSTADLAHLFETIAKGSGPLCALRVKALEHFGPHPYVARKITGWLLDAPFEGKNRAQCLGPALEVLRACADPRSTKVLAEVTTAAARPNTVRTVGLKNWMALKELATSAARWKVKAPVGSLDGLGAPAKARRVDLQTLWSEVFAAPDDVQRKLVLADALQEQGDARGEFIALQLARTGDQRPTKREKELLAQHRETWMGPLADVLRSPEYEGGLLVGGRLKGSVDALESGLEHPSWQAVRRLDCERVGMTIVRAVLGNRRASHLEQVTGLFGAALPELVHRGPLPWVHLELPWSAETTLQELAQAHANLPKLATLAVRETELDPDLELGVEAFARSTLGSRLRAFGTWKLQTLPRLLTAFRDTRVERLVLEGPRLVMCLDVQTRVLRVFVTSYDGQALAVPEGLAQVELVHPEGTDSAELRGLKRTLEHSGPVKASVGPFRRLRELLTELN